MKTEILSALFVCASLSLSAQVYSPSPMFGTDGVKSIDSWGGSETANSYLLQSDGKLIVAGTGYWNSPNSFHAVIARLDTACAGPDMSFGTAGVANVVFEQRTKCYNIAQDYNGKIIGCGMNATSNGFSGHKPSVFRLNNDGSVDSTFNGTGFNKSTFDGVSSGCFWQTFVYPDGRVTCVGASIANINGGTVSLGAQRFLENGTLDTSFAGSGVSRIYGNLSAYYMAWEHGTGVMHADSSVTVICIVEQGTVSDLIAMARFKYNGDPDTTFGVNGLLITASEVDKSTDPGGLDVALDANGNMLVSATAPGGGFVMLRYLSDGSPDASYGVNGRSEYIGSSSERGRGFELLADGTTLQFGTSHWNNGPPTVVKRMSDGALDTGFGSNGVQTVVVGTPYKHFVGGLMLPSGDIVGYGKDQSGASGGSMIVAKITTDPSAGGFVDLGADISFCDGDSAELNAPTGLTWLWSDSSTTQDLIVHSDGDYSVTVSNAAGCVDSDTLSVVVNALPMQPTITLVGGINLSTTASGDLQWYLDGVLISGATMAAYIALVNGDYTVVVTDPSTTCSSSSAITTVATVGIEPVLSDAQISLYPNPSGDMVFLDGLSGIEITAVYVFDLLGQRVDIDWRNGKPITVSHLMSGQYRLVLKTDQQQLSIPFVKN